MPNYVMIIKVVKHLTKIFVVCYFEFCIINYLGKVNYREKKKKIPNLILNVCNDL